MRKNLQKGFTLIELLVVIAIIGILATIVLTSLGSATKNAKDAKISGQVAGMRAQAQLYAGGTPAALTGVCTAAELSGASLFGTANNGLGSLLSGYLTNSDCESDANYPSAGGQWAVALKLNTGAYACADYTGISRTTTSLTLAASAAGGTLAAINSTVGSIGCTAL